MSYMIQQSTTAWELLFLMVQSADHITALTGASPTVTLRKSGGSFASPAGAVSEIANGWYKVAGNATDTNTLGPLLLHATAASGDPTDTSFDVVAFNPQDAVHLGLTSLPNTAVTTNGSLLTSGSGAAQIAVNGSGKVSGVVLTDTLTTYTGNTVQTGDAFARVGLAGVGLTNLGDTRIAHLDADISTRTKPADTQAAVTVVGSVTGAVGSVTGAVGSVTAIATSGGKVSGVILTDTLTTYTGNTPQTGDAFARIGLAGAGLTNLGDARIANLDAAVTTRMATYTQPTGFLAANFPTSVASPTNITAGTITNLTNAPTVGDFTATMKASLDAATPASVVGAVGSVTGNVGGNLVGSVGSLSTQAKTDVENATWNTTLSGHLSAGSTGKALSSASSITDPWSITIPGAYSAGTAGYIVGNTLDAAVSSRTKPSDTQAAVTLVGTTTNLTNAPANGDLTAVMKASVTTAATAATPTAAAVTAAVTVNGASPLTETYPSKGATLTLANALYGLTQRNDNMSITGTTLSVFKRDGTTVAQTFTLDAVPNTTAIAQATP